MKRLKKFMTSYPGILEYQIREKSIVFHCSGLDEDNRADKNNNAIGELFNQFLLELSEDHKVFFHAYRLPEEDVKKLIDPNEILEKAEVFLDPFQTFFYLKSAKIRSTYCGRACNADIYYFDRKTEWTDFLASSVITHPVKLVEKGVLSARFSSCDCGADFYFVCNKTYENRVLQLIEKMASLGYGEKRSWSVSLPYSG